MNARIVKITGVDGLVLYQIQQKEHWPFWPFSKKWVNAWLLSSEGAACGDTFYTEEDARRNLCYFNGSLTKVDVVR